LPFANILVCDRKCPLYRQKADGVISECCPVAARDSHQQLSHSLSTPSAIVISVRSRFVPEHRPQDANEEQYCNWPMKPDSVQTGENID